MLINIADVWKSARIAHNRYLEQVIDEGIRSLHSSPIQRRATQFLKSLKTQLTSRRPDSLQSAINSHEKLKRKMSRHELSELNALLGRIFDYRLFITKRKQRWSAYKLCKSLAYRICPYCHHAYMLVTEEKERGIRPDLDHYYPQGRYPYLALALNNLIPSCSTCNSRLKGSTDMASKPFLNPLLDPESLHFRCEKPGSSIVDIISDFENIKEELRIRIVHDPACEKSTNSLVLFQLRERYDQFSREGADFVGAKTSIDNLDDLFRAQAQGPIQQNSASFMPPNKDKEVRQLRFNRSHYKHYVHGKMFADLYDQFDRSSLLGKSYP